MRMYLQAPSNKEIDILDAMFEALEKGPYRILFTGLVLAGGNSELSKLTLSDQLIKLITDSLEDKSLSPEMNFSPALQAIEQLSVGAKHLNQFVTIWRKIDLANVLPSNGKGSSASSASKQTIIDSFRTSVNNNRNSICIVESMVNLCQLALGNDNRAVAGLMRKMGETFSLQTVLQAITDAKITAESAESSSSEAVRKANTRKILEPLISGLIMRNETNLLCFVDMITKHPEKVFPNDTDLNKK